MELRILVYSNQIKKDINLLNELRKLAITQIVEKIQQLPSLLKTTKVDLILIEIEESYYKIFAVINSLNKTDPSIPIVIIDGGENQNVTIKAFRSGVKDYFKKPYKSHLLLERIQALLQKQ